MAWRNTARRTRQRNTLVNSQQWTNTQQSPEMMAPPSEVIGMHVRVLRYHEIRLGNIEKQLSLTFL